MHCHAHQEIRASARCTRCGVLLCAICRAERDGRALCSNCVQGGGEVVKAIRVFAPRVPPTPPAPPIPPAMPIARPVVIREIHSPSPILTPSSPPPTPTPPAARYKRPAVAGILGAVPGLGHLYAGKPLRGLGILLLAPVAVALTAAGAVPLAAYAFLHGLVAFDGYRCARKRNGTWTHEDSREAKGVWFATAGAIVLLGLAHAAGAPFSPGLVWPAVLIPLGVGLALGERTNRVNRHLELTPVPAPKPPAPPKAPPVPTEPAPGVEIDRRADRAKLAEQLSV